MAESARRGRDAARPAVETLEGRMVLSVDAMLASAGGVPSVQSNYVPYKATLQSGEVDLIVTRASAHARAASPFQVSTIGSYDKALKPNAPMPHLGRNIIGASTGPDGRSVTLKVPTTGPHRSTLPFVPIDGTYHFAPGQTSLRIPIRLNPRFIPPNGDTKVSVSVWVSDPRDHSIINGTSVFLSIFPSADQIPPEIIGSSRTPGAITLTFSQPMNPATAEDVTNYKVHGPSNDGSQPIPLESAVYNPATQSVTLTPTVPLTQSGYSVGHGNDGKSPTDLHGNAAVFGDFGLFLP